MVAVNLAARGCIEALNGEGAAEIAEAAMAGSERWPFDDGSAREK